MLVVGAEAVLWEMDPQNVYVADVEASLYDFTNIRASIDPHQPATLSVSDEISHGESVALIVTRRNPLSSCRGNSSICDKQTLQSDLREAAMSMAWAENAARTFEPPAPPTWCPVSAATTTSAAGRHGLQPRARASHRQRNLHRGLSHPLRAAQATGVSDKAAYVVNTSSPQHRG